ncbi:hypothetical protein H2248_011775 [Termitomyces sp. 'cryptogamus']|nr:hypothetical protein H2248_011775 [Termitomyces sp. 'cryptogamus']
MRKMGEPFEIANKKANGALSDVLFDMEYKAFQHYETTYGLRHLDIHHHNYVFHETGNGKWQAELIDWSNAEVMDWVKRPCEGKVELVAIDHH